MKKLLSAALCVSMMATMMLTGCGSTSTETSSAAVETASAEETTEAAETEKTYNAIYLTATAEGDYWQAMNQGFVDGLAELGINLEVSSADNDAVRQVEQIENAVQKGYDLIMVFPVDPDSVKDACKKAMDQGIPVYAFIKDPGEGYRTATWGSDEGGMGREIVDYASDWAKENWGDNGELADGSVDLLIVGGNSAGSETERYEAMCEEAEANPIFNILNETRIETSQSAAQDATENFIAQYPDVDIILYGSVEMAVGGMTYIESEASPIKDYSNFAIFAGGLSQEAADDITRSAEGNGVIKGVVNNGTGTFEENALKMGAVWLQILNGEDYEEHQYNGFGRVDVTNLAENGF